MNEFQKEIVNILNRRLAESAKFWYQCIDEYQEINEFVSTLNALIQSLRNITFILQKQKGKLKNFDQWYSTKQVMMRNDPSLKWLHEARTQVVKRGDLKLYSVAVGTVKNWLDHELFSLQVDPLISNDDIISTVMSSPKIKNIVIAFREPLLQIERIWRVDDLPGREILEVLSSCYKKLKSIIFDFYKEMGIENPELVEFKEKDQLLISNLVTIQSRTTNIDLKDGSIINFHRHMQPLSQENMKKAIQKFGSKLAVNVSQLRDHSDPFTSLSILVEASKRILQIDGYHIPLVYYYFEDKSPEPLIIQSSDKTEQYYIVRHIAEEILTKQITGLIFIQEHWIYSLDKDQDRSECLTVSCIRKDGKFEAHLTEFKRENGSIVLEPTKIETNLKVQYWLRSIVEAWQLDI